MEEKNKFIFQPPELEIIGIDNDIITKSTDGQIEDQDDWGLGSNDDT